MFFKSSLAFLAVAATIGVQASELNWFADRNCDGSSIIDQRNIGCDTCQTPGGDFYGCLVSGVSDSQQVSFHNEPDCTTASLVGQQYGSYCSIAGGTALKSVYIAC
ncbi:hypothetical protein BJ138DRAFT_1147323 [Hygrophoropsis aurantiaca]|uniref:Uncharacterized protein n=1 Tax=Hygrophoropsis aurantiaca TaxID=72124 RepID=A0ACB8AI86_9AGAM|nr:hypothetical protein BJ138DRAFT_1147323 [Hygrophoropsis aurantiaca]